MVSVSSGVAMESLAIGHRTSAASFRPSYDENDDDRDSKTSDEPYRVHLMHSTDF
jgi:hypothetical protein